MSILKSTIFGVIPNVFIEQQGLNVNKKFLQQIHGWVRGWGGGGVRGEINCTCSLNVSVNLLYLRESNILRDGFRCPG